MTEKPMQRFLRRLIETDQSDLATDPCQIFTAEDLAFPSFLYFEAISMVCTPHRFKRTHRQDHDMKGDLIELN